MFINNRFLLHSHPYWNFNTTRSRIFTIDQKSRQKCIRGTSCIRNNMNAFVLQIRHPINGIGGQKGDRGDFDVLSKKVKGKIYFEKDEGKGD